MSVTITVSYQRPDELQTIVRKLHPYVKRTKLQPPKGKYKRAYLHMKDIPIIPGSGGESTACACIPPDDLL